QLRRRRAELEAEIAARTAELVRANAALTAARAELEQLAGEDALTGLPNRRVFETRLQRALDRLRQEGGRLAVLFLDLDNFKALNDRLGHPAGDGLLRAVADRLGARMKANESLARLGGDEFVVLVEGVIGDTEVAATAQGLIDTLADPFPVPGGGNWRIGVSIGVALAPDDGHSPDALLHAADRAVYAAKAAGRGTWRLPQA
ncbi:MAG: diguanylate cyclase domain-containing protein, partial [Ferrovibrionaceae bacterium]